MALTVAQRTHHLVFAGLPGTGKTTIARVVAKIYCGLGLLEKENVREVHRADLIGQHIGETEAKTNAIIDSALDGVLFLDEGVRLGGHRCQERLPGWWPSTRCWRAWRTTAIGWW